MDWTQTAAIIGALTAVIGLVIGLQSFWIARSLDALGSELGVLRSELHRGFDRLEVRVDRVDTRIGRLEGGPPSLRRV